MSPDIFLRKNDLTYGNCGGAVEIADDTEVLSNDSTHELCLHNTMKRTCKEGIKLKFW